jgi:hypothetical protein
MEPIFDVFITIDGNLRYQQNLKGRAIALVILSAMDNTFDTLIPLMPHVVAVLPTLTAGQIVEVTAQPEVSDGVAEGRRV